MFIRAVARKLMGVRRARHNRQRLRLSFKTLRRACKALDLRHLRTRPYTPRTNGKAERFVQTRLREWAYASPYATSAERSDALPAFLHQYNHRRVHAGIGYKTPISRLRLNNVSGLNI